MDVYGDDAVGITKGLAWCVVYSFVYILPHLCNASGNKERNASYCLNCGVWWVRDTG
jgi:hypothetical protein